MTPRELQDAEALQLAAKEKHPVHIGCGGECEARSRSTAKSFPNLYHCHGCEKAVRGKDVMRPEYAGPEMFAFYVGKLLAALKDTKKNPDEKLKEARLLLGEVIYDDRTLNEDRLAGAVGVILDLLELKEKA